MRINMAAMVATAAAFVAASGGAAAQAYPARSITFLVNAVGAAFHARTICALDGPDVPGIIRIDGALPESAKAPEAIRMIANNWSTNAMPPRLARLTVRPLPRSTI